MKNTKLIEDVVKGMNGPQSFPAVPILPITRLKIKPIFLVRVAVAVSLRDELQVAERGGRRSWGIGVQDRAAIVRPEHGGDDLGHQCP